MFRNRKLFERSVRLVRLRFGLHASNTRLVELLYICIEAWLEIFIADEFQCFDRSSYLRCDHDYTRIYMCRGYQKMVQKFYNQEREDLRGLWTNSFL